MEAQIREALEERDFERAATLAIRGYGPEILGYLVVLMRDREVAAELFAQFGEALWKGLPRFRAESTFRTWAYAVAWRIAKRAQRDRRRNRARRLDTDELSGIAAEVRSQTESFLKSAARERLSVMRASLTPLEQSILTLRIDRDMSWREVAEVLDDPEQRMNELAVRKRFERLKTKLRRLSETAG